MSLSAGVLFHSFALRLLLGVADFSRPQLLEVVRGPLRHFSHRENIPYEAKSQ